MNYILSHPEFCLLPYQLLRWSIDSPVKQLCVSGDKDTEETVVSPVQERPKKKKKKRNNAENTTETANIKGKIAAATVVLKGFKKGVTKAKLQRLLKQR